MTESSDQPPVFKIHPAAHERAIRAGLAVMSRRHPSIRWEWVPDEPHASGHGPATALDDDRGQDAA